MNLHHNFYSCRPDRDDYIAILKENILTEKLDNFDKKSGTEIDSLGQPYDYFSIMHYRKVRHQYPVHIVSVSYYTVNTSAMYKIGLILLCNGRLLMRFEYLMRRPSGTSNHFSLLIYHCILSARQN